MCETDLLAIGERDHPGLLGLRELWFERRDLHGRLQHPQGGPGRRSDVEEELPHQRRERAQAITNEIVAKAMRDRKRLTRGTAIATKRRPCDLQGEERVA